MPDPIPSPAPKKRHVKEPRLNQAQIAAITEAETLAGVGLKTVYAPALAKRAFDDVRLKALQKACADARTAGSGAIQKTVEKEVDTDVIGHEAIDLLEVMEEIQSAGKQKYQRTAPLKMQDYFVGQRLDASRNTLLQYSQSMLDKLAGDTLPGIDAATVTKLTARRKAYADSKGDQTGAQSDATGERKTLAQMVHDIVSERIALQYAANAEWSYRNPLNDGIRTEFHLPLDRTFDA